MAQQTAQRRVRRPKDKTELIERLIQADSPFTTMRDVLIFAAGVGWNRKHRLSFEGTEEPIHWATMTSRAGVEPLINMLALSQSDDVTILAESRFDERILIFEEYANGGLEVIGELLNNTPKTVLDIVRTLVNQVAGTGKNSPDRINIAGVDIEF